MSCRAQAPPACAATAIPQAALMLTAPCCACRMASSRCTVDAGLQKAVVPATKANTHSNKRVSAPVESVSVPATPAMRAIPMSTMLQAVTPCSRYFWIALLKAHATTRLVNAHSIPLVKASGASAEAHCQHHGLRGGPSATSCLSGRHVAGLGGPRPCKYHNAREATHASCCCQA